MGRLRSTERPNSTNSVRLGKESGLARFLLVPYMPLATRDYDCPIAASELLSVTVGAVIKGPLTP